MPNTKTKKPVDVTIKEKDKKTATDGIDVITPFLQGILPIYFFTTTSKKAELRLHNPTLDWFITLYENSQR
jgi:hypothetical protein